MLKFYWNGVKDNGGKLQRCFYSDGQLAAPHMPGTLTIYKRDYGNFSEGVWRSFKVENDSDSMTDYFETSHIRVAPSHDLYAQVKAAHAEQKSHQERRSANRQARLARGR